MNTPSSWALLISALFIIGVATWAFWPGEVDMDEDYHGETFTLTVSHLQLAYLIGSLGVSCDIAQQSKIAHYTMGNFGQAESLDRNLVDLVELHNYLVDVHENPIFGAHSNG